jgi:hypothetical protein
MNAKRITLHVALAFSLILGPFLSGKTKTWGGFQKSWAKGIKHIAHRKSGRQCKKLSARRKYMIPN